MSHGDPVKWGMPGWRIEQKFSPGVLIGNWGEERYNFLRGQVPKNTTNRRDFKSWGPVKPDVVVRRKGQLRNDGLDKEFLFYHHGNKYSNNMISWYDEHYNKRERETQDCLPELRSWSSHRLAWAPEKSDHPINGQPTRWGLYEKLQNKWKDQVADGVKGDYLSVYTDSFHEKELPQTQRYAVPRELSTILHKYNNLNQDLTLRNVQVLKQPEVLHSSPYQC